MANFDATEIIKYLFGSLVTLGGGYVLFVIKSIGKDIASVSKDIMQLKEFFMLQIKTLESDIIQHRKDIQELYDLQREDSKTLIELKSDLKGLRDEHNRRSCEVK